MLKDAKRLWSITYQVVWGPSENHPSPHLNLPQWTDKELTVAVVGEDLRPDSAINKLMAQVLGEVSWDNRKPLKVSISKVLIAEPGWVLV